MQLSTKVRYAARAMIELTLKYDREPVQLNDIACKQNISVKYLEQIMAPLRTRGYVRTQKGSRGGYHLAVNPGEVTLLDIVETIDGPVAPVSCVNNEDSCERQTLCVTRSVWRNLGEAIKKELSSYSLSDLAVEQQRLYNNN